MSDLRNLRNEDFRRLIATPSSTGGSHSSRGPGVKEAPHGFTHKQSAASGAKKSHHKHHHKPTKEKEGEEDIFDESQARLNEIMKNYRDRASERRKGAMPEDDALLRAKMTAAYRAVPGTFVAAATQADRRRAEIQESKFLGGDIEHTHLVKGLDFSLLNKVRSEIEDGEGQDELERVYEEEQQLAAKPAELTAEAAPTLQSSSNRMVRNLNRIITNKLQQQQGNETPASTRNEMFARGRMAYIVELGEEVEGTDDVPATLMRSVHDCPDPMADAVNADAVLISKLTQVLGYLRSDPKRRKHHDESKSTAPPTSSSSSKGGYGAPSKAPPSTGSDMKIFDDVDSEYAPPSRTSSNSRRESSRRRDGDDGNRSRPAGSRGSYFDDYKRSGDGGRRDTSRERDRRGESHDARSDRKRAGESAATSSAAKVDAKDGGSAPLEPPPLSAEGDSKLAAKKRRLEEEEDAYAELYPMGSGMVFAGGDSDDEGEDFSKMDTGAKKGPVKRWDFETQGEFETYQDGREAVPKAAFQYGMKTNEGRKTRKTAAAEKAAEERKLDRELDRINKVWDERKKSAPAEGTGRSGASRY